MEIPLELRHSVSACGFLSTSLALQQQNPTAQKSPGLSLPRVPLFSCCQASGPESYGHPQTWPRPPAALLATSVAPSPTETLNEASPSVLLSHFVHLSVEALRQDREFWVGRGQILPVLALAGGCPVNAERTYQFKAENLTDPGIRVIIFWHEG